MPGKIKKQFGVWMDSHNATIVGRENIDSGDFVIIAHEVNNPQEGNSSENQANHSAITLQQNFFKDICSHMQNVEEVHVTGTGQEQEQFIRYLSETQQFKKTIAKDSTSTKMSDEKLLEYMTVLFN